MDPVIKCNLSNSLSSKHNPVTHRNLINKISNSHSLFNSNQSSSNINTSHRFNQDLPTFSTATRPIWTQMCKHGHNIMLKEDWIQRAVYIL